MNNLYSILNSNWPRLKRVQNIHTRSTRSRDSSDGTNELPVTCEEPGGHLTSLADLIVQTDVLAFVNLKSYRTIVKNKGVFIIGCYLLVTRFFFCKVSLVKNIWTERFFGITEIACKVSFPGQTKSAVIFCLPICVLS